MAAPSVKITNNLNDKDGLSSRNPSWCVTFFRFKEPASSYGAHSTVGLMAQSAPEVIENDCIGVTINRPKGNPFKTATVTLKVGQIYYQNFTSPGDWVIIHMSDQQSLIDEVIDIISKYNPNSTKKKPSLGFSSSSKTTVKTINDVHSGFKFIGRVTGTGNTDQVTATGQRILVSTITCQSFLELASSVYYSYTSEAVANTLESPTLSGNFSNLNVKSALDSALGNLAGKYLSWGSLCDPTFRTPDKVVPAAYVMVADVTDPGMANFAPSMAPSGNDATALQVPSIVNGLMGRDPYTPLFRFNNFITGLQEYGNGSMFPNTQGGDLSCFYYSNKPLMGFIPYVQPPLWSNVSIWSFMNQFTNETVNELYTCYKLDPHGRIMPTIVLRQKPFSTNLYNTFAGGKMAKDFKETSAKVTDYESQSSSVSGLDITANASLGDAIDSDIKQDKITKITSDAAVEAQFKNVAQTMYGNLPQWILDESIILSVNTQCSEQDRINLVQVWGTCDSLEVFNIKMQAEQYKMQQFQKLNYVIDNPDILRHGLRADIQTTTFDIAGPNGGINSLSPVFARLRADWLFNGHLKLKGTITTLGIVEPICEGDNVVCRGILYHIDGLSFNGQINDQGQKIFTTTIQVSNGIVASSVASGTTQMPSYAHHMGGGRYSGLPQAPGVTDVQFIADHKSNRDENGEMKQ